MICKNHHPLARAGRREPTRGRDGWGSPGDKAPGTWELRDFCCNLTKEMLFTGKRIFWGGNCISRLKEKNGASLPGSHLRARWWQAETGAGAREQPGWDAVGGSARHTHVPRARSPAWPHHQSRQPRTRQRLPRLTTGEARSAGGPRTV